MSSCQNESSPQERYGHNLTRLAQQGTFSPLVGQETAVNGIFQILQQKNKCNPVLIDFDETRRWAVVAEAIRRIEVGDAPDPLFKRQVIALDYEALFSNQPGGTSDSGKGKDTPIERLGSVFNAMHQAAGTFVLFVDHFHRIVGGERDRYPIDATTLLKPLLARQQIQLIGACPLEQYQQYIERDASLQRRCQHVFTPEAKQKYQRQWENHQKLCSIQKR